MSIYKGWILHLKTINCSLATERLLPWYSHLLNKYASSFGKCDIRTKLTFARKFHDTAAFENLTQLSMNERWRYMHEIITSLEFVEEETRRWIFSARILLFDLKTQPINFVSRILLIDFNYCDDFCVKEMIMNQRMYICILFCCSLIFDVFLISSLAMIMYSNHI